MRANELRANELRASHKIASADVICNEGRYIMRFPVRMSSSNNSYRSLCAVVHYTIARIMEQVHAYISVQPSAATNNPGKSYRRSRMQNRQPQE